MSQKHSMVNCINPTETIFSDYIMMTSYTQTQFAVTEHIYDGGGRDRERERERNIPWIT